MSDTLFWLLVGHAVGDFALQSEFMARAKNHTTESGRHYWPYALGAHALIHGGIVAAATRSTKLGMAEVVLHALTDRARCSGLLTTMQDQAVHLACKIVYVALSARKKANNI